MTVNVGDVSDVQSEAAMSERVPQSRRSLLGRGGLLVAAGAFAMGLLPNPSLGKKKKNKDKDNKDKKKQKDKSLSVNDFLGNWLTALSNGVTGNLTFIGDDLPHSVDGLYYNTVGAGTVHCTIHGEHGRTLHCRYSQGNGETGGFIASLNGKNSWIGNYFIDGGSSLIITGVRSKH